MKKVFVILLSLMSTYSWAGTITCYNGPLLMPFSVDTYKVKMEGEGANADIGGNIEVEIYLSDSKSRTFNLQINKVVGESKFILTSTTLRTQGITYLTYNLNCGAGPVEDEDIIQITCKNQK